jgi:predicted lipid carrier protein YhbT
MHGYQPPNLSTAVLSAIPAPLLARLVAVLTHGMRRRHPQLVSNFKRLDPAVVHIAPTDLPHRFALIFGDGRMEVRVLLPGSPQAANATIRGGLLALIDLLEGRIDGDAMFFSRDIQITGSTAVIVAVRNTLDREEISMRDEIASLFGPLERPVRFMVRRFGKVVGRSRRRVSAMHASLHAADAPPRDVAAECDALRAEVKALHTRLAKLDVRQTRTATLITGVGITGVGITGVGATGAGPTGAA